MSATMTTPGRGIPPTEESGALILTRKLERYYQLGSETVRALRGVDLTVGRNEYVAVMGPSGSG
jgi:putative ABC transport system ATP-binding protein